MMTTVREARVEAARTAIHTAIQCSVDVRSETFVEITKDVWLVDGGVNLAWLAEAVVDALFTPDPHLDNVEVPLKVREDDGSVWVVNQDNPADRVMVETPTSPGIIAAREQRKLGINR